MYRFGAKKTSKFVYLAKDFNNVSTRQNQTMTIDAPRVVLASISPHVALRLRVVSPPPSLSTTR
jgi:hypothetical protein